MHIFSKFEKFYAYFCPSLSSYMLLMVSFADLTTFWSTSCRIDGNISPWFFISFHWKWLSLILNARPLPLLPYFTFHLITCYLLAPISNPFGENCIQKKNIFYCFSHRVSFRFFILGHQLWKTFQVFSSMFHTC